MSVRVAINGFGRIGRVSLRAALAKSDIEVVAVNDLGSPDLLGHLFKYDSVHGVLPNTVEVEGDTMYVDGQSHQTIG